MARDREQLRDALAWPRSEAARDAARELGAIGTLDDIGLLEKALADARRHYKQLSRARYQQSGPPQCAWADAEIESGAWNDSVGPFEEALALLQARLHPDGGIAALASAGCTVSLLSSHIRWRNDIDLFARLLAVMSCDESDAFYTAFREVSVLVTCSDLVWRQRAALAVGGWGPRIVVADLGEQLEAAIQLAGAYGWKPADRQRADLMMVSLAFGSLRFGGWDARFLPPALAAIQAAVTPRIVPLLDARLADLSESLGRNQLRMALQSRAQPA